MGRLIDADSFKNFIESLPKNPNGTSRVYDEASILRFVDAQSTAYNVDAVVAELEKASKTMMPVIPTKDAVAIVKRGGVE